jgi:hypothetical protein
MKKKLLVAAACLCFFVSMGMTRGFWDLYISGPDTRCALGPWGFGAWTIEDTYQEPIDPNNQYEWFIMDYEAKESGYPMPGYPVGRPGYDIDREFNIEPTWGEGIDAVTEVTITCKITNGSNVRYESFTIVECSE